MSELTLEKEIQAQPPTTVTLSMQQALNRALDETLDANPRTLVFGEDVGLLGGVFRITDGLQKKYGQDRVFDTPLAESGILGMSAAAALCQWASPYASPVLAVSKPLSTMVNPLRSYFAHVPGLTVVSPSDPHQAFHLLKHAATRPDPVIFMEPKSRYWQKGQADLDNAGDLTGSRVVREGKHATLVAWGAMVSRCLQTAELAAEDGIELEVLDVRWVKPIDAAGLAASISKTKRAVVVHEAPRSAGLGAEVASIITEQCFNILRAPVERVTGFDVPYPSGDLEDEDIPNVDRILYGVATILEWFVAVGDQIERNQPLRIFGEPGEAVYVGEPLIVFEVPDDTRRHRGHRPAETEPKRRVRLSAVLDED